MPLIEPYSCWNKVAKKKHWMEIVEEEHLFFKSLQETQLPQVAQQQVQNIPMSPAGAGGVPPYSYFHSNTAIYWQSDVSVTGNPVSSWSSNNNINLTQDTAGNRPVVSSSIFNTTQGIYFDGANDILSYTGKITEKTDVGTISVVFKTPNNLTSSMVLLSQSDSSALNDWWEMGIASDGRIYIESNNAGTKLTVKGSNFLSASTIYNTILSYDGTDYYLLLNNTEENPLTIENIGSFSWLGRISGTPVFSVGGTVISSGATRFFNGFIGAVYVWDTDLTA